jgi:PKHD-type hydroxylase
MMFVLKNILTEDEVVKLSGFMKSGTFVDGKLTASGKAKKVKKNEQADRKDKLTLEMEKIVLNALYREKKFHRLTIPKKVLPPMFARYEKGMAYGFHVDNPLMSKGAPPIRTDLSMTLFLCDADSYTGGELRIKTAMGTRKFKGDTGDLVIYPSTYLHEVTEVKKGKRMVAVTWVQSYIADPWQREVLYDLTKAKALVGGAKKEEAREKLAEAYGHLMRMWAR